MIFIDISDIRINIISVEYYHTEKNEKEGLIISIGWKEIVFQDDGYEHH